PPKGEGGIGGLRPAFLAPRTPTRSVGCASVARRGGGGASSAAKLVPPPRPPRSSPGAPTPPPLPGGEVGGIEPTGRRQRVRAKRGPMTGSAPPDDGLREIRDRAP